MGFLLTTIKLIGGHLFAFAIECITDIIITTIFKPKKMVEDFSESVRTYSQIVKPIQISF